jgi:hypothetical protein
MSKPRSINRYGLSRDILELLTSQPTWIASRDWTGGVSATWPHTRAMGLPEVLHDHRPGGRGRLNYTPCTGLPPTPPP